MHIPSLRKTSRKPHGAADGWKDPSSFMVDSPPFATRKRLISSSFPSTSTSTSTTPSTSYSLGGPTTRISKDVIREERETRCSSPSKVRRLFRRVFESRRRRRDCKLDILISQLDAVIRKQDQVSEKEEFITGVLKEFVREWKELPIDNRIANKNGMECDFQAAATEKMMASVLEKISELGQRLAGTRYIERAMKEGDMRERENKTQQQHHDHRRDRDNEQQYQSTTSRLRPGSIDRKTFGAFCPSREAQHGAETSRTARDCVTSGNQHSNSQPEAPLQRGLALPHIDKTARTNSKSTTVREPRNRSDDLASLINTPGNNKKRESFIQEQTISASSLHSQHNSPLPAISPHPAEKDSPNSFVHQTRLRFEPPTPDARRFAIERGGSFVHQPSQLFEPSRSDATASTSFHVRKKPAIEVVTYRRTQVSSPARETFRTSRILARRDSVIFHSDDDNAEISLKDPQVPRLGRTNYERIHPSTEAMEFRIARRRQSRHSLSDISEYSIDIPYIANPRHSAVSPSTRVKPSQKGRLTSQDMQ